MRTSYHLNPSNESISPAELLDSPSTKKVHHDIGKEDRRSMEQIPCSNMPEQMQRDV